MTADCVNLMVPWYYKIAIMEEYQRARRRLQELTRRAKSVTILDDENELESTEGICDRDALTFEADDGSEEAGSCLDGGRPSGSDEATELSAESLLALAKDQQKAARSSVEHHGALDEAMASLERMIRTAGLRRGRENELLDELGEAKRRARLALDSCAAREQSAAREAHALAQARAAQRLARAAVEAAQAARADERAQCDAAAEARLQVVFKDFQFFFSLTCWVVTIAASRWSLLKP